MEESPKFLLATTSREFFPAANIKAGRPASSKPTLPSTAVSTLYPSSSTTKPIFRGESVEGSAGFGIYKSGRVPADEFSYTIHKKNRVLIGAVS